MLFGFMPLVLCLWFYAFCLCFLFMPFRFFLHYLLTFIRINRGNTVLFFSLKLNDPAQKQLLLFTFFSGSFALFQLIRIFKELLLSLFAFCFQYAFSFIAARTAAVALL